MFLLLKAKWLGRNLGPTIRNSSYSDLKIIIHDDQRLLLPFLQEVFVFLK